MENADVLVLEGALPPPEAFSVCIIRLNRVLALVGADDRRDRSCANRSNHLSFLRRSEVGIEEGDGGGGNSV